MYTQTITATKGNPFQTFQSHFFIQNLLLLFIKDLPHFLDGHSLTSSFVLASRDIFTNFIFVTAEKAQSWETATQLSLDRSSPQFSRQIVMFVARAIQALSHCFVTSPLHLRHLSLAMSFKNELEFLNRCWIFLHLDAGHGKQSKNVSNNTFFHCTLPSCNFKSTKRAPS